MGRVRIWMLCAVAAGSLHCDEDVLVDSKDHGFVDSGMPWDTDADAAVPTSNQGPSAAGQHGGQPVRPDHAKQKVKVKVRQPMTKKLPDFRVVADGGTN